MRAKTLLSILAAGGAAVATVHAEEKATAPAPRPVPRMQALPLPHQEISFQRDGNELARYHYGPELNRPFLYPIVGPSGRSLTRMGHPHDPESHSHHNSIWISHHDVGDADFWGDRARHQGRIVHQRVDRFVDGDDEAFVEVVNHWQGTNGVLLVERRRVTARHGSDDEWLLILDLEFRTDRPVVELGKTPFGFMGVRMAKTIGVHDGGGTIRNSEGAVNESGVFWKPARWVDYAGLIAPGRIEGLTLFDHPSNPNHPAVFHVRDDGWMGPSLTFAEPRRLKRGETLRLRYGVFVHGGPGEPAELERAWRRFADLAPAEFEENR